MVRKYLRYLVYEFVIIGSYLISIFYKIKNFRKERIFIYTDSRGFEISRILNRKNPFSSYAKYLIKNFCVDYCICPCRHTTIMDFLDTFQKRKKQYSFVVLHVGVVDFSPRPISMVVQVMRVKERLYSKYFNPKQISIHLQSQYETRYKGEFTNSLYSLTMAEESIVPKLRAIENLIWIGCSRVLGNWQGNYPDRRPENMDIIMEFNSLFLENLENSIDLSKWHDAEIKQYTCDNIHLSQEGMAFVENELLSIIEKRIGGSKNL